MNEDIDRYKNIKSIKIGDTFTMSDNEWLCVDKCVSEKRLLAVKKEDTSYLGVNNITDELILKRADELNVQVIHWYDLDISHLYYMND